ncbi:hypothetical protein HY085_03240 [Candidatus Gottesmanbacteria bacterium]|nr:hypothetical protein [Candidatus Gottesmanbacteria bacterium]
MKKLHRLILVFLLLFFFVKPVFADEPKFKVSFDLVYKIETDGKTVVTQNFHLTNLTNQYYPVEYAVKLGNKKIYNLRAFDQTGTFKIEIVKEEIHIKFNDQIVGQDKTLNWTLIYETPEVAHHNGRLWEIFIPKPAELENASDYTISLYFSKEFGKNVYLWPKPDIDDHTWSQAVIKPEGVRAVFDPFNLGLSYQNYNFKLSYRLYNSRLYPVNMDIALPRDTARQKVFLNNLSPKPVDVSLDASGNWLASYQLGPAGNLDITAVGNLAVFLPAKIETQKFAGYVMENGKGNFYSWTQTFPDFNHLILAVNNNRAALPIDAEIFYVNDNLDLNLPPKIGLRVDIAGGKIYVENYGPTVFPGGNVTLSSGVLTISDPILPTGVLAPFATKTLTFNLAPGGLFSIQNDIITLKFADQTRNYPVSKKPFFANKFILTVSVLFTLGLVSLTAQIIRGLSFFGQKQKR